MTGFGRSGLKNAYLQPLTNEELSRIHLSSMEVLGKTGILVYDEEILELLSIAGCEVDKAKNLVRIPEKIVEEAIDKAPGMITLCGRDEEKDMHLGDGKLYVRTPGGATRFLDFETQEVRDATRDDLINCIRVADALPNIHGISMFQVVPRDVPIEMVDIYAAEASFRNTEKHHFYVCHNDACIEDVVKMAACVVGGEEALKKRPIISALCEATAPLRLVEHQMKVLKTFAKRGLPLMLHSHPIAGFTSPVTLGGELVVTNAEVLSLMVISQLVHPHTPVVYGMSSSIPDMRTGLNLAGAVEIGLMGAAVAQLARHYCLPCSMTSGIDSEIPDAEATMERIMTALPPILAGIDLLNVSTLNTKLYFSLEQLVIDNEIISWIERYLQGIKIDEESLAVDLIHDVGPGGSFADNTHTVKHFRRELITEGLIRGRRGIQESVGIGDIQAKVRDEVKRILKVDRPRSMEEETFSRIAGIMEKWKRD